MILYSRNSRPLCEYDCRDHSRSPTLYHLGVIYYKLDIIERRGVKE